MQYTGKQIVENNIITNTIKECIQSQGVDLRVKKISILNDEIGLIPKTGKTIIPKSTEIEPCNNIYTLTPGYYEVEFEEGCNIPENTTIRLHSRSSLIRCCCEVRAGQFDAGFYTNNIGCYLKVEQPVMIEKGARITQCIVNESYNVSTCDLYNGQWQNDKQR